MTTPSFSPEERQRLIADYVLYNLTPEDAARLEQCAATDPTIAAEMAQALEEMQRSLEVAFATTEVAPPAYLRAAVLNQIRSELADTATPPENLVIPTHWSNRWLLIGASAIAAAIMVGLGINNVMLRRSLQLARSQSGQTVPAATQQISLAPTATSTVSSEVNFTVEVDTDNLQATIQAENLDPLPPEQVYVLWTVLQADAPFTTDDQNAILTHVFNVDDQGNLMPQLVALPSVYQEAAWVKAVAVTIEDADAPQSHQSAPILIDML
ncbi:MAG: anti-sigma factor domain-containing protein [Leptolyngbyaceae cyanobacterium]